MWRERDRQVVEMTTLQEPTAAGRVCAALWQNNGSLDHVLVIKNSFN